MQDDVERCEHGIRWPHPCDDCEAEALKPHNLIARIESQSETIATLQANLDKAVEGLERIADIDPLDTDMFSSAVAKNPILLAQSLTKELRP